MRKIIVKILDVEGNAVREYRVSEKYRTIIQDTLMNLTILDKYETKEADSQ